VKVSIIIVQYNNAHLTGAAVESLLSQHPEDVEVLIVDNASTEAGSDALRGRYPEVHYIQSPANNGFGAANNLGARESRGEILLFLNNDVLLTTDPLPELREAFADPSVGVAGPRLVNRDGSFQLSAGRLPSLIQEAADKALYELVDRSWWLAVKCSERRFSRKQDVGWVTGAALAIRRALFDRIGGFDERFFMYFEEKDLCKRVHEAGLRVLYSPETSIVHFKGGSGSPGVSSRLAREYRMSQRLYYSKHRPKFEQVLLDLYLMARGKYSA
jgi:N-acetylglucosaminyl-diphospho-decaprenol L-rhamnosyltransferase